MENLLTYQNHFEHAKFAILCSVQLPEVHDSDFHGSIEELGRLATTLGLTVIGKMTQKRNFFDAATYIGPGKIDEMMTLLNSAPQETIILVDHEISPSQARNIENATEHHVLDRTAVILEIFNQHAHSRQAKLQVEMVRLAYLAPRLRESPNKEDRQRGFIGGKGAGETALELDRRKIRDRIAFLRKEIASVQKEQQLRRGRRNSIRKVAICGYTNAGKSTLFQALTKSDTYVADKLFATLDTTVRILQPETKPKILISDTIGFIRNLPTKLIASFKSTLEEVLEASLILHVVDISDPDWKNHIQTTQTILKEIGSSAQEFLIGNKIDKLTDPSHLNSDSNKEGSAIQFCISAYNPMDVDKVKKLIQDTLDQELIQQEIFIPFDKQNIRSDVFSNSQVIQEKPDKKTGGSWLLIKTHPDYLKQVESWLSKS